MTFPRYLTRFTEISSTRGTSAPFWIIEELRANIHPSNVPAESRFYHRYRFSLALLTDIVSRGPSVNLNSDTTANRSALHASLPLLSFFLLSSLSRVPAIPASLSLSVGQKISRDRSIHRSNFDSGLWASSATPQAFQINVTCMNFISRGRSCFHGVGVGRTEVDSRFTKRFLTSGLEKSTRINLGARPTIKPDCPYIPGQCVARYFKPGV